MISLYVNDFRNKQEPKHYFMKALIHILTLFLGKINGAVSNTRSTDGRKQNGSSPVMMFALILVHSIFAT